MIEMVWFLYVKLRFPGTNYLIKTIKMHYVMIESVMTRRIAVSLIIYFVFLSSTFADEVHKQDLLNQGSPSYQEKLDLLLGSENHSAILEFLDSLASEVPYNPKLSWQYARSLFLSGRLDAASDSLMMWEEDSVYRTRAENMLVQIAVQQRNHHEAIMYLIRLRDRYPENPVYPYRLARVFAASNQLLAAEGQYSKAYRLDTLNQLVIGEWAEVLQKLDFTRRAYRTLLRGIKGSPENHGFRRQLVNVTYTMRRPKEVIEHASFLTLQGDTAAQTVKLKAFALFQLDSLDRAEYWIDYLLDNHFYGEDVFFYKGKLLAARNDKIQAQKYFDQAAYSCLSPNFNNFVMQAGINLYETKQYADAIRWFQMLRIFSENPMITFYLASTYFEYYEDQEPAYRQFTLFLEQSTRDEEETHRAYARSRIREITEERHFRGE